MDEKLDLNDRLIARNPLQEFEEYVKREIQIESRFGDEDLDLYFEVLELGKELIEKS